MRRSGGTPGAGAVGEAAESLRFGAALWRRRGRAEMAARPGALLRECPLLLPQTRDGSVYEGFVTVQGRDFHIRILLPSDLQLKNARIQCSWELKRLLNGYLKILKQRLQHSSDLVSFMVELKTVLVKE